MEGMGVFDSEEEADVEPERSERLIARRKESLRGIVDVLAQVLHSP
jgi:hypothetical protein